MSEVTKGYKTRHMDGDLSLGRDLHLGGGVNAQGDSHFKGNLRVDGRLEVDLVDVSNKGLFGSVEELSAAYPHPKDGWWALVGDGFPAAVYRCQDGQWIATGGDSGEITIDADGNAQLQQDIDVLKKGISPRSYINVNVLLNTLNDLSFDDVPTLLEEEGFATRDWIRFGTVITFKSAGGWKAYRFLSDDPDNGILSSSNWEEVVSGSTPTDTLLGLMGVKPCCKKVHRYWDEGVEGHEPREHKMGVVEVTHPILDAMAQGGDFPLQNVKVCLMRYVKRVGKKYDKHKKGWVQCYEKRYHGDWNNIDLSKGFYPEISGKILRFRLYDMVEFVMQNYLCVETYYRDDLKGFSLSDMLKEGHYAWFGNDKISLPDSPKQRTHFGIALRCDNPNFKGYESADCTRYQGENRYIYSDVYDIVVDVIGFKDGNIGTSFLG